MGHRKFQSEMQTPAIDLGQAGGYHKCPHSGRIPFLKKSKITWKSLDFIYVCVNSSYHLLSTDHMPGTVLSTLYEQSQPIITITP